MIIGEAGIALNGDQEVTSRMNDDNHKNHHLLSPSSRQKAIKICNKASILKQLRLMMIIRSLFTHPQHELRSITRKYF